jgi:cell division protein FtsX
MSEPQPPPTFPVPVPPPSTTDGPPAPSGTAADPQGPDQDRPARRWLALVSVAVVAALLGAAVATGVIVLSGWRAEPSHRFSVLVFLNTDVTAAQRDAVRSRLTALHPVGGVQFEDRAQAWQKFQKNFKDLAPDLANSSRPESMPESFRLVLRARAFDCSVLAPVRALPGIDEIKVVQYPEKGRPGAMIGC